MNKLSNREVEQLEKLKQRQDRQNEYLKGKYDRVNITVNKGYKTEIEKAAAASGLSVNEFCRNAIIKAVQESAKKNSDSLPFPEV